MVLSDRTIKMMLRQGDLRIDPAMLGKCRTNEAGEPAISYGITSYGYDIRVAADGVQIFDPADEVEEIDPKQFDIRLLRPASRYDWLTNSPGYVLIPAHGYALARSLEYFEMPADCIAICIGKSTYARAGLVLNATPIEPGWRGYITLEIANAGPRPVRLYLNEGIGQLLFLRGDQPCAAPYSGPYQDQGPEVVPPRVGGGA